MSEENKEFSYYDATPEEIEKHEKGESVGPKEEKKIEPAEAEDFSYYNSTPEEIEKHEKGVKVSEEKIKEEPKEFSYYDATPEEIKEHDEITKKTSVDKPSELTPEKVEKNQEPILEQKIQENKEEKAKEGKDEQIEKAIELLISLAERRDALYPGFDKQRGLMYKLGIKRRDSKIDEEYTQVYREWENAVKLVAKLTNTGEAAVMEKYKANKSEKGEKTPEDERKLKEAMGFLNEKRDEINKEVEGMEQGKKGSFEKLKALVKDRRFQIILGLAIAGVAIAAPPTGFVSMVTFGMHPGFLPAVYVMETKVIEGFIGGALVAKGIYDNAEKIKEKGVNLVEGMKKSEKAN